MLPMKRLILATLALVSLTAFGFPSSFPAVVFNPTNMIVSPTNLVIPSVTTTSNVLSAAIVASGTNSLGQLLTTSNTLATATASAASTAATGVANAATAQATANAAAPKSGATFTGPIVFDSSQPSGSTSTKGILQVIDSTGSTSTTAAASPNSVKTVNDAVAAAQATADAATTQAFKVSTSGLTATVGSGIIRDAIGTPIIYAGGTITLVASVTNFLCIALADGSLHCLERAIDSGIVPVAIIPTSGIAALSTNYPPTLAMPPTWVGRFKASQVNTVRTLTVALCGSSLGEQSDFGWLFNTSSAAFGQNLPAATHNVFYNYSGGSQSSFYTLAMMGKSLAPNPLSVNQDFSGTAAAQSSYLDNFSGGNGFVGTKSTQESPILAQAPDLYIGEGILYNRQSATTARSYDLGMAESVCRKIVRARRKGANIDAILYTTGSATSGNANDRWDEGYLIKQMADYYGCAVADFAAFHRESWRNGLIASSDGIHPLPLGCSNNCLSIGGILNGYSQVVFPPVTALGPRIMDYVTSGASATYAGIFPESADMAMIPNYTTGILTNASSLSVRTNQQPKLLFGGGNATNNSFVRLQAGDVATYAGNLLQTLGFTIEPPVSNFTYRVTYQNGGGRSVIGITNSVTAHAAINAFLIPGPSLDEISAINPGGFGAQAYYVNSGFQFEVLTGGPVDLICAAQYGPEYEIVPWDRVELHSVTNTLSMKPWVRGSTSGFGRNGCVTTDALGDFVVVPFTGAGISFQVQGNPSGATLDYYVDGNLKGTVNSYVAGGSYLFQWNYLARTSGTTAAGFSSASHILTIHLRALDASAVAPSGNNHLLKLQNVTVIL